MIDQRQHTRLATRRQLLSRRRFVVVGVSLLAAVTAQACIGDPVGQAGQEPAPTLAPPADDRSASTGPVDGPATTPPAPPPGQTVAPAIIDTAPSADGKVYGLAYLAVPDPNFSDTVRARSIELSNLVREPGQPVRLRGRLVEVVNHGVLVSRDRATGKLHGVPMGNAETSSSDGFNFRPRSGGPLPWENEDRAGAENGRALESARFGEVNAYYHADRTLAYANDLLAELGERPLPLLRVVVNAHTCSRLPGYRQDDGDRRSGKPLPFPGGHYRLPTTAFPESPFRHPVDEMSSTGEVHLGPGNTYIVDSRGRTVVIDGYAYSKNAAHIPGIIVHEVGHHINSHTADFRANRLRKRNESSNRKIHMDEGTADYWAAVLLETPDIFNWQRAAEDVDDRDNRDLRGPRTTDEFDRSGEPHRNGNIWSSALWDVRRALGKRSSDLLVMKTLLLFSQVAPADPSADEDDRQRAIEQKDELRDGLRVLLEADRLLNESANRARLRDIFKRRGIDLNTPDDAFG